MKTLAIIPARGGSKGIRRKNMAQIAGYPLIHYSIDVAIASNLFSGIVVTSDDDEILEYASRFPVYTHKRTPELASDTSPIIETIQTVIRFAEHSLNIDFDAIMLLQPTSPLRTVGHLEKALQLLTNSAEANSVISVTQVQDVHPARMYNIEDNKLKSLLPEYEHQRRQDLPGVYIRNGSIYLARKKSIKEKNDIMVKPSIPFVMNYSYYLNIDEPRDLAIARYMMEESNVQLCA